MSELYQTATDEIAALTKNWKERADRHSHEFGLPLDDHLLGLPFIFLDRNGGGVSGKITGFHYYNSESDVPSIQVDVDRFKELTILFFYPDKTIVGKWTLRGVNNMDLVVNIEGTLILPTVQF